MSGGWLLGKTSSASYAWDLLVSQCQGKLRHRFPASGLSSSNFLPWLQKLTNVRIMKENMRTGNLPANMKKARVIQIIPCKAVSM